MSRESMLVARRTAGRTPEWSEAEPVVVEQDGAIVRLVLDDGETLEFDATELRATLEKAA